MQDFNKLYQLQNKFLTWLLTLNMPIYLTGGTALGRFYLYHRFCDNLYLHVNDSNRFLNYISNLNSKIGDTFNLDKNSTQYSEDFASFVIIEDQVSLKIDLIRNVTFNPHKLTDYKYGQIDTPLNILPKKLKALLWRNNEEDIFDIVHIAKSYSFNWADISSNIELFAKYRFKDIKKRIEKYPVGKIKKATWHKSKFDSVAFKTDLLQIAHDFETGANNSLGLNKLKLEMALPIKEFQI